MSENNIIRFNLGLPRGLGNKLIDFADKTGRSRNGAYIHILEGFFDGTTSQVIETQRSLDVNTLLTSTVVVLAVGTLSSNGPLLFLSFGLALVTTAKILQP